MARAFANFSNVAFSSDGQYFITYEVTYVDPVQALVAPVEVTVQVGATDTSLQMQIKTTAAIKQTGADMGLAVTNAEITQPAYIKGITIYATVNAVSLTNVNVSSPGSTIDNYTLAPDDRVLLVGQTDTRQNGIFIWHSASESLTRASDADGAGEVVIGAAASVLAGDNAGTQWMVVSTSPSPWVAETSTSKWVKFVFPTLF